MESPQRVEGQQYPQGQTGYYQQGHYAYPGSPPRQPEYAKGPVGGYKKTHPKAITSIILGCTSLGIFLLSAGLTFIGLFTIVCCICSPITHIAGIVVAIIGMLMAKKAQMETDDNPKTYTWGPTATIGGMLSTGGLLANIIGTLILIGLWLTLLLNRSLLFGP